MNQNASPLSTGTVLAALLTRVAPGKMNGKHTAFFNSARSRSNRVRSHKV